MVDVRRVFRGSRFRRGWRVSALVAWVTSLAVLFTQGIAPSYAGIRVSTFGSSDTVRMEVLEWSAGIPTRVAAYVSDHLEPVTTSIDPSIVRNARWIESGKSRGWTQGKLLLDAARLPASLDVTYRNADSGLDVIASDPANPANTLSIRVPAGDTASPENWIPVIVAAIAVLAILSCAGLAAARDESCASAAKTACGDSGVKCVTSPAHCGLGSCRYQCKGDGGSCD